MAYVVTAVNTAAQARARRAMVAACNAGSGGGGGRAAAAVCEGLHFCSQPGPTRAADGQYLL